LLPTVWKTLDRTANVACDDDAAFAHADPGVHGRQEKREALLAEGPLEQSGDADVVSHPDSTRELDISPRPAGMPLQGLRLGEAEEGRHALSRDPPLHPAVSAFRHRTRTWMRG
jgi:hypothetical protein